ncbi:MAG TPA: extracellular solute-binding protein [Anaeromyxobacteraceae bacterium]|nr:extracellular solute-binding protein [Anaeromyxobacteraceae bacterium]
MRRLARLVLAAALALPALAAAQEAKVVVWHAYRGGEKAAFEKVIAAYNARPATKVKVEPLAVPYDAFADKITAAVPRGKGPDVFIYAQDRLGGWIEAGNTVEPIDFYVDDALKARFIPTTVEALTYRGSLYGLPLDYKCITLIYNKRLVKAPPRTSAELVALGQKQTSKAAGQFGLAWAYGDFYYVASLLNGFGGAVFAGTRPTLDAPENVKALELLVRWGKDGFMPAEPSTALITSLFNEGKAAMVLSGPWFLGEVDKGIDYGLAPLPALTEAGGKPMRPWMTVEGAFVAAPSRQKEAAFDFVRWLTDVEAARVMALEGRQSPAVKAVYDDPKVATDGVLAAFRKQVEVALPMPNLPEMSMVWSPATTALGKVNRGAASPKEALQAAQLAVEKAVAGLHKAR